MSLVHVHLILNHVPVIGIVFACVLLLAGALRRNATLSRAGLVTLVAAAAFALPTYFTGEPAEHAVEHLAGIDEATIERHEDAAKVAIVAIELLGVLALAGLVMFRRAAEIPRMFTAGILFLSLAGAGMLAWTASLGGEIRHPEIHQAATPTDGGRQDATDNRGPGSVERRDRARDDD